MHHHLVDFHFDEFDALGDLCLAEHLGIYGKGYGLNSVKSRLQGYFQRGVAVSYHGDTHGVAACLCLKLICSLLVAGNSGYNIACGVKKGYGCPTQGLTVCGIHHCAFDSGRLLSGTLCLYQTREEEDHSGCEHRSLCKYCFHSDICCIQFLHFFDDAKVW